MTLALAFVLGLAQSQAAPLDTTAMVLRAARAAGFSYSNVVGNLAGYTKVNRRIIDTIANALGRQITHDSAVSTLPRCGQFTGLRLARVSPGEVTARNDSVYVTFRVGCLEPTNVAIYQEATIGFAANAPLVQPAGAPSAHSITWRDIGREEARAARARDEAAAIDAARLRSRDAPDSVARRARLEEKRDFTRTIVLLALCALVLVNAATWKGSGHPALAALMGLRPVPSPSFRAKHYLLSIALAILLTLAWMVHFAMRLNNEFAGMIFLGVFMFTVSAAMLSLAHTVALQRLRSAGILPSVALALLLLLLASFPYRELFDDLGVWYTVAYGVIVGLPMSRAAWRARPQASPAPTPPAPPTEDAASSPPAPAAAPVAASAPAAKMPYRRYAVLAAILAAIYLLDMGGRISLYGRHVFTGFLVFMGMPVLLSLAHTALMRRIPRSGWVSSILLAALLSIIPISQLTDFLGATHPDPMLGEIIVETFLYALAYGIIVGVWHFRESRK